MQLYSQRILRRLAADTPVIVLCENRPRMQANQQCYRGEVKRVMKQASELKMAKLTATAVRNAGAAAKSYKLADGGGLYLFVNTKGARYWRYDYRFAGARKTLALGVYPEVSLKDARERHEGAREMLANNLDPSAQKKLQKLHADVEANNTFEAVADEWRV